MHVTTANLKKTPICISGFILIFLFLYYFSLADEQIDLEKQRLYPETAIQIYSPGGGHISKQSSRRGSGNNNSDKGSLCNNSQYSQSRRGSNRSSGGESEKSRRASLARNGAIVTSGMYFRSPFSDGRRQGAENPRNFCGLCLWVTEPLINNSI